ncbi:hypothetical protein [Priestia aryabhattai]|uniref:hypothetical protein n=1 Tax=Priestia aryabhattai TaxID=412384 RepID=UPI000BFBBB5D|nr:hypothetical protein [Priestia aryabhattai]PHF65839.1 hypothetical protein COI42_23305 [Priestia aryabhattai]
MEHVENEVYINRLELLLKEINQKNIYLYKFYLSDHPLFEILYEIHKKNIFNNVNNEVLIINFLTSVTEENWLNKVELIKIIGVNIIKYINNLNYDKEDYELERSLSLLKAEANNSQTLISFKKISKGLLEVHESFKRNPRIIRKSQPGTLNLVNAKEVISLPKFSGKIKKDNHNPGYHFHYCKRIKGDTYEITRYLLSYNSNKQEHLAKLPPLYWEVHGNYNSNYVLSNDPQFRRAVYHCCNAERRKLFKTLKLDQMRQLKFRNKSKDAKRFYDPLIQESKKRKKNYSVIIQK